MAAEPPALSRAATMVSRRPQLVVLEGEGGRPAVTDDRGLVVHVVAARSDAVKLAPVHAALVERGAFRQSVLHTGQHADASLTSEILADVGLAPDHALDTAGDSPGARTARAIVTAEALLKELRPSVVIVAGAADSTLGVVLAAARLGVPIARLEAGLRDGAPASGEEINRTLIDAAAHTLLAPTRAAAERLRASGAGEEQVRVVGSTAVDSLRRARNDAAAREVWKRFGAAPGGYVLVTLHRPENVDDDERLARIVEALAALAQRWPVIFPLHPRTCERLKPMGDIHRLLSAGVLCGPPLAYLDFLSLQCHAAAVLTDSGTVQEEASALGVPCYTLRSRTERDITLTHGTNVLVGDDPRDLADVHPAALARSSRTIPLWDGHAASRVAEALVARYVLPAAACR